MSERTPNNKPLPVGRNEDRYDALFSRIHMGDDQDSKQQNENVVKGFWLRLAENEGYERLNLATTYLVVFLHLLPLFLRCSLVVTQCNGLLRLRVGSKH